MKKLLCPAVALIVLSLRVPAAFAQDHEIVYGHGRRIAYLASKKIVESSGLACGRANKDTFWTHNDSGDKPQIYAFGIKGEELATISLSGAEARDWEDMASFSHGGRHYLLIADVGDNRAKRSSCTLYVVPEPKLHGDKKPMEASATPVQTIPFRYEDGPHNCESVAVDPQTCTVYLVPRVEGSRCKVYSLPLPEQESGKIAVAKAVANLNISPATAMDISPDGLRAIVFTRREAFEFVRGAKETWEQGFSRPPRRIATPRWGGGMESVCYGADGKTLYLTLECKDKDSGNPSPLLEVPVKHESNTAPNKPNTGDGK